MSAAETGQMSAVETKQMLKSQIRGQAQNHRDGSRIVARSRELTHMDRTATPNLAFEIGPTARLRRLQTPDRDVADRDAKVLWLRSQTPGPQGNVT